MCKLWFIHPSISLHFWVHKYGRSYMLYDHSHISCWNPPWPGASRLPRLLGPHRLRSLVSKQRQRWNRLEEPLRRPKLYIGDWGCSPVGNVCDVCGTDAPMSERWTTDHISKPWPSGMKVMYVIIAGVWHTVAFLYSPAFCKSHVAATRKQLPWVWKHGTKNTCFEDFWSNPAHSFKTITSILFLCPRRCIPRKRNNIPFWYRLGIPEESWRYVHIVAPRKSSPPNLQAYSRQQWRLHGWCRPCWGVDVRNGDWSTLVFFLWRYVCM